MLITPNFEKVLKGFFVALLAFYLIQLVQQFTGTHGISLSSPNSFLRVFLNEVIKYGLLLIFWLSIYYLTKDRLACIAAIFVQVLATVYVRSLFSSSADLSHDEILELLHTLNSVRIFADIICYGLFGILHLKSAKGLWLAFVPLITWGITSGQAFSFESSYLNTILRLLDLDNLFRIRINTGENSYRYVELSRQMYTHVILLFDLIVFWFVYSAMKAGKRFDFSLRTIQLNAVIGQLTFSLIYWALRIVLVGATLGIGKLIGNSLEGEFSYSAMVQIVAACLSIFVVGSLYRNFLTDYHITKGYYPGWLYWTLNIPVLNFFAWIITFFLPAKPPVMFSNNSTLIEKQDRFDTSDGIEGASLESTEQEGNGTGEEPATMHEGPLVYYIHPLQTDFVQESRNSMIKVLLILFSIAMIAWQFRDSNSGYTRPGSGEVETPFMIILITLALTIWYMYDRKALIPLFLMQSFGILFIVFFRIQEYSNVVVGAGLVNMMIYYSLFHFDQLNLIEAKTNDTQTITAEPKT